MINTSIKANILHIQRFSTEDGPGLRTSVFFKGCPLSCAWCHNPESILGKPQLQWFRDRCMHCHTCVSTCPNNNLSFSNETLFIDGDRCIGCGICAEECPANALEILGRQVSLDWLTAEILKDIAYYQKSGGGVTATGGEPLLQDRFLELFFERMLQEGIQTALDTCGYVPIEKFYSTLKFTNVLLFDLKEIDPLKHQKFTHHTNQIILENFIELSRWLPVHYPDIHLWVRTPLIPGATATPENVRGIGEFLDKYASEILQRWDLLAYNNLATSKYERLNLSYQFEKTPLMTRDELVIFESIAKETFRSNPDIVFATGSVKP